MARPNLNIDTKQIRNFSMEHHMHRYFNEIPSIKRQVADINRKNNDVARLLDNKERFTATSEEERKVTSVNRPYDKPAEKLVSKEQFTVKKRVTFGDIIDSILSFILAIVFIVFMGNLAYICFFEDSGNDSLYV